MEFKGKFVLLGMEKKTSAKGNEYVVGLLQQGTETLRGMVKMKTIPQLDNYKEYNCIVNYNPAYQRMDIVDIQKLA